MARALINNLRLIKWILLISSLITLIYLIGAAIKENFLSEWRYHQRQYKKILLSKANDESSKKLAKNFRVQLQQVVIPELNTIDRCVSCHLGIDDPRMIDVPNPYKVHPGNFLETHPVDKFGCTICHRGQGRSIVFKEAKAEGYFWDYPLLPVKMTQASCGVCHNPSSVRDSGAEKLAHGEQLFKDKGCMSCHKLNTIGGPLGPLLDNEGKRVIHNLQVAHLKGPHTVTNWLVEHFYDPQAIVPTSQMKNLRLSPSDIEDLTIYMLSLQQIDLNRQYIPNDKYKELYLKTNRPVATGEKLYKQYCYSCHEAGTYGRWDKLFGKFIPAIRNPAYLSQIPDGLLVATIHQGRTGTLMPAWNEKAGGLNNEEIQAIVDFIKENREHTDIVKFEFTGQSNKEKGKQLYQFQCAGCHGINGKNGIAPTLSNPVFQQTYSDQQIAMTIQKGRKDTAMPAFQSSGKAGLSNQEIFNIVTFIRTLNPTSNQLAKQ